MKIRDIIESVETATMPNSAKQSLPASMSPNMDQYYEYYRFLISIAGFPDNETIPTSGPVKDRPFIVPYTEIERQQSIKLLKKLGKSIEHVSTNKSCEVHDKRNTISPVRTFVDMDNK